MEALQKELDALELKKKELLEKMEGEKPILKKELAALLAARAPIPVSVQEHFTVYLASGLGMTTIDPISDKPEPQFGCETPSRVMYNPTTYEKIIATLTK